MVTFYNYFRDPKDVTCMSKQYSNNSIKLDMDKDQTALFENTLYLVLSNQQVCDVCVSIA